MAKPEFAADFRREMLANARASLACEPGCRQFDVCEVADSPAEIFLYERYDDRASFEAHMTTPHFEAFDALTAPWVTSKTVRTYALIEQG